MTKLMLFLLLTFSLSSTSDVVISDVRIKGTYSIEGQTLILNGAGLREKYFIDLYVAGMYLSRKDKNPISIINGKGYQVLEINVISSLVTKDKFNESLEDGYELATNGNTKPFRTYIDKLKNSFQTDFKIGDKIVIMYSPKRGMLAFMNGKEVFSETNFEFKKITWEIWLGNEPVDEDLKAGLLGVQN